MSISPTVGSLAKLLRKVRFDHRYRLAKRESTQLLNIFPLGKHMKRLIARMERGVKGVVMPTMIWEELGFTYIGPIDGHNLTDLEKALSQARDHGFKPTLLHIITTKGKGYQPAEGDAVYFHGVSAQGASPKSTPSYSQVFAATVLRLMQKNPRIVVITPAMPEGHGLVPVQQQFPRRVFDVGICEQHAVTFAAGLATQGFLPIVAIYSTFLQRSYDQIIHDVCLQNLPVVFALDRSGIVGDDGKTHQGTFDLSYLIPIPNLSISAPKDENELQHLLYTAVGAGQPMAVRYPRGPGLGVTLDAELHKIPIGSGEVLREGADIAIVAIGATVTPALEAAQELVSSGIEATVVNGRFAKPVDRELLTALVNRAKYLVTVEENVINGGFGTVVTSLLKETNQPDIRMKSIGIPDEFVEHGTQAILRAKYSLDAQGIARQIMGFLSTDVHKHLGNHKTGLPIREKL